MKLATYILLLFTFIFNQYQAQEAKQMIEMYKFKLFDEKNLKPFSSVKMTLEITTKEGKFPATLLLMEDLVYKLQMQTKEGKSTEFIDQSKYVLFSSNRKEKKQEEVNSEMHFRKKIWLNFYPFLHNRMEYPFKEIQAGMDLNGAVTAVAVSVENISPPVQELLDPSIKKYVQLLPFSEMSHSFYFDLKTREVIKIETRYLDNGREKNDVVLFGRSIRSPEGYYYPESFTTIFGEATVKSILFNPKLNSSDVELNF